MKDQIHIQISGEDSVERAKKILDAAGVQSCDVTTVVLSIETGEGEQEDSDTDTGVTESESEPEPEPVKMNDGGTSTKPKHHPGPGDTPIYKGRVKEGAVMPDTKRAKLMRILLDSPGQTALELSQVTEMGKGQISAHLSDLDSRGYIDREKQNLPTGGLVYTCEVNRAGREALREGELFKEMMEEEE